MNDEAGGRRHWYVPDAYLPGDSSHGVESHESACLLNTGEPGRRRPPHLLLRGPRSRRPGRGGARRAAHTPRPADGSRRSCRASSCRATCRSPTRSRATFRSSSSTRGSTRPRAPTPSPRPSRMASRSARAPGDRRARRAVAPPRLGSARHELRRRQHLGQGRARRPDHRRVPQRARGEGLRRRPRHADRRRARPGRPRAAARDGARLRGRRPRGRDGRAARPRPLRARAAPCPRSTRRCTDFSPPPTSTISTPTR